MDLKEIINLESKNLAFIVGNGLNLYNNKSDSTSWLSLLRGLCNNVDHRDVDIPEGVSYTEFYDILCIKITQNNRQLENDGIVKNDIARQVCNKLEKFEVNDTHKKLGGKRIHPFLSVDYLL